MSEQRYTIQGLEEYIRQSEPDRRERGEAWRDALACCLYGRGHECGQSAKDMVQSANSALNLPSKCKFCTLEEIIQ